MMLSGPTLLSIGAGMQKDEYKAVEGAKLHGKIYLTCLLIKLICSRSHYLPGLDLTLFSYVN